MKSCTIIISHYESLHFLHTCIRKIRQFAHPEIKQKIIIADQSCEDVHQLIHALYAQKADISVIWTQPLYSGHSVDFALRNCNIKTDYICQLHVDAFPIHQSWLLLPITLIEEYNFSFAGQLHFYSRPTDTIYPPGIFFSMSPTFNVAKTETYRKMSLHGGFTRYHERKKIEPAFHYQSTDWDEWAMQDYANRGSDDDVPAFHWEDKYKQHNKIGLSLTGMMGIPGQDPGFGRIIEDLVFHFGFGCEHKGVGDKMGTNYLYWMNRIKQEGLTDDMIEEMLKVARTNNADLSHPSGTQQRTMWNAVNKTVHTSTDTMDQRIEELKKI